MKVEIYIAPQPDPQVTLSMQQWVLPHDGALEAMLDVEGAGRATVETSRELVNELREYVFEAAHATGPFGIPPRLLAAIVYKEALDRPKDPTGWRNVYNLSEMANAPSVRSRELFLASEDIKNANLANIMSVQEDNSGRLSDEASDFSLCFLAGRRGWRSRKARSSRSRSRRKKTGRTWVTIS